MSGAIPLLLPYAFVAWTATLPGHSSKWAFSKFNSEALHEPHYMVCTQCLTCPGQIVLASAIWMKIIKSPHTHVAPCFISKTTKADLYEIWYLGTYILNIARKRFESPGDIVHPPLKVTATALTHSIVPLPSGRWKFCAY